MMSAAVVGVALTLGVACRGGERNDERARLANADELARKGKLALADSQVVAALVTPKVPGRIIYDPPEDLSLANARRMRPDIVNGDTSRDTSHAASRRDTTGGDATVDTSGGAARKKRL